MVYHALQLVPDCENRQSLVKVGLLVKAVIGERNIMWHAACHPNSANGRCHNKGVPIFMGNGKKKHYPLEPHKSWAIKPLLACIFAIGKALLAMQQDYFSSIYFK